MDNSAAPVGARAGKAGHAKTPTARCAIGVRGGLGRRSRRSGQEAAAAGVDELDEPESDDPPDEEPPDDDPLDEEPFEDDPEFDVVLDDEPEERLSVR